MKPEILITQNPNSDSPLLDRSFWAKLFETFQPIYGDVEQANLAVAKRVLDRETDSTIEDMAPEELITRAIQAFEYVEPFKNTEAGKPLFNRVLRMLAGSSNNASMPAYWSPEAVNQFAKYYKDSKYQDYKFTFVSLTPHSIRFIDVTSKELPDLLSEDDLSWLPRAIESFEGQSIYLADYTPEFTDENVKSNAPIPISPNMWRIIWAKIFETDQLIYDDTEQASLAVAKRVLDRETDSTMEDMPPETLITRAIQAFEYVEPFKDTEAGKPLFNRVLRMLTGSNNDASMNNIYWSPEAINQFAEYYKDSKYQDYKFTFASFLACAIDVTGKKPGTVSAVEWVKCGGEPDECGWKPYESASMPSSTVNPPMLGTSSQQDFSFGMGLALGTLAGFGAAYLVKKCGLFKHTAAAPVVAPDNQPQNNISPAPRTSRTK